MADCTDSVRLTVDGVLGGEVDSMHGSALLGPDRRQGLVGDLMEELWE